MPIEDFGKNISHFFIFKVETEHNEKCIWLEDIQKEFTHEHKQYVAIKHSEKYGKELPTYRLVKKNNYGNGEYIYSNDVFEFNFADNYIILHSSTSPHIDLITALAKLLTSTNISSVERLRISTVNEDGSFVGFSKELDYNLKLYVNGLIVKPMYESIHLSTLIQVIEENSSYHKK